MVKWIAMDYLGNLTLIATGMGRREEHFSRSDQLTKNLVPWWRDKGQLPERLPFWKEVVCSMSRFSTSK